MNKTNIWCNQAFCFRVSLVFILLWLAISAAISLIIYLSFRDEVWNDLILEFSTGFFIIPSIIFFGFINAIPLILDWVLEPFADMEIEATTEADRENTSTKSKKSTTKKRTSYSKLSTQLENAAPEKIQ